ncbi:MAG: 1-acyl-sn-glycerol-3-phosphate acyltransferase [Candidatus Contendobacter odensis]|uniref:1-acyl-sn-glycerol-3-phosphate acyltransferase n=1 Tax=Candidatus Contendibacter odensensis TaxID=1400860 RepID=A0A2G6PGN6_9GAMM|nr:MAG: 1-acyl-sn-glycerol-3-phosphate acyltransferase [Candidatus Contendobacter odensis]
MDNTYTEPEPPPDSGAATRTFIPILLRSFLFSIGMVLSTAIISTAVLLCFPLPFAYRYKVSQLWSRFNLWWLSVTCRINYQVHGAEHIPDHPVVIMSKHQSTWETLFFQQYLPPVAWVIKRELLWIPLFGWALYLLRPIAINRQASISSVKQVIRRGGAHLKQGQWVVIFPEGTRTAPHTRQRYGIGGAALASQNGYPVLPVALNAGEYWPRKSFIKYPGTIKVVFGASIETKDRSPQAITRQVEHWIEDTMAQIGCAVANDQNNQ